jgi:hypothetical protein
MSANSLKGETMKKTTRLLAALGFITVGVLGLAGLQAFAAPRPSLPTIPAAVAAPLATSVATNSIQSVDPALESKVRDMLQKRMGLSAADADKLAKSMAEHMQAVHGDQAGNLANACAGQGDASGNTTGATGYGGMMGGGNGGTGYGGMMGGANGANGSNYGGMMGGSL